MTPLRIEPLTRADVESLCSLAATVWRHHYPSIIGGAQTEYMLAQRYTPELIVAELARGDVWWDTVRADGDIVAFASSFPGEEIGTLKLDKLYVHPEQQRMGYGGALIEHTCDRAARNGYRRVILHVNKRNTGAIAAYERRGFEIRDAVVKAIGGGFVMDDFVMERRVAFSGERSARSSKIA